MFQPTGSRLPVDLRLSREISHHGGGITLTGRFHFTKYILNPDIIDIYVCTYMYGVGRGGMVRVKYVGIYL